MKPFFVFDDEEMIREEEYKKKVDNEMKEMDSKQARNIRN